jgi:hypothetical protein
MNNPKPRNQASFQPSHKGCNRPFPPELFYLNQHSTNRDFRIQNSASAKTVTISAGLARFIYRTLDMVVPKNLGCHNRQVTLIQLLEVIDILSCLESVADNDQDNFWCKGKYSSPDDIFIELNKRGCTKLDVPKINWF